VQVLNVTCGCAGGCRWLQVVAGGCRLCRWLQVVVQVLMAQEPNGSGGHTDVQYLMAQKPNGSGGHTMPCLTLGCVCMCSSKALCRKCRKDRTQDVMLLLDKARCCKAGQPQTHFLRDMHMLRTSVLQNVLSKRYAVLSIIYAHVAHIRPAEREEAAGHQAAMASICRRQEGQ